MFQGTIRVRNGTDLNKVVVQLLAAEGQFEVGLPRALTYRRAGKAPIPAWLVAEIVNNGTEDGRIPERQAVQGAVDRHGPAWQRSLLARALQVVQGRVSAAKTLGRLSRRISKDIQDSYMGWDEPPNAPDTVRKKGFNDPLVETSVLAKSYQGEWRPARRRTPTTLRSITKAFSRLRLDFGRRR